MRLFYARAITFTLSRGTNKANFCYAAGNHTLPLLWRPGFDSLTNSKVSFCYLFLYLFIYTVLPPLKQGFRQEWAEQTV